MGKLFVVQPAKVHKLDYTALEGTKRHSCMRFLLITLHNRFALETLLAEDQGVCDIVGAECFVVISKQAGLLAEGHPDLETYNLRSEQLTRI